MTCAYKSRMYWEVKWGYTSESTEHSLTLTHVYTLLACQDPHFLWKYVIVVIYFFIIFALPKTGLCYCSTALWYLISITQLHHTSNKAHVDKQRHNIPSLCVSAADDKEDDSFKASASARMSRCKVSGAEFDLCSIFLWIFFFWYPLLPLLDLYFTALF